jgi:hypothetical protein
VAPSYKFCPAGSRLVALQEKSNMQVSRGKMPV